MTTRKEQALRKESTRRLIQMQHAGRVLVEALEATGTGMADGYSLQDLADVTSIRLRKFRDDMAELKGSVGRLTAEKDKMTELVKENEKLKREQKWMRLMCANLSQLLTITFADDDPQMHTHPTTYDGRDIPVLYKVVNRIEEILRMEDHTNRSLALANLRDSLRAFAVPGGSSKP